MDNNQSSEASKTLDPTMATMQEKLEAKVTKKIVTKLISALSDLMLVETETEIVDGIKELRIEDQNEPTTSKAADENSLAKSIEPAGNMKAVFGDVEMLSGIHTVSQILDATSKNSVKEYPKKVYLCKAPGFEDPPFLCPKAKPLSKRFDDIHRGSAIDLRKNHHQIDESSDAMLSRATCAGKRRVITVPSPTEAEQPKHCNTVCDKCDKPIVGIRYKCVQCFDFDLCQDCEALPNVHNEDHHFLKIKKPLDMPSNKFMSKIFLHHFTRNPPRMACNLIFPPRNYYSATPSDSANATAATAPETSPDVFASKLTDEEEKGIEMAESKATKDAFPTLTKPVKRPRDDRASRKLEKLRLRCDASQKRLNAQLNDSPLMNRHEKRSGNDKYSTGSALYLGGILVSDATVPENTRFSPGACFKKVWKVRNNGTMAWTSRTTLRLVEENNAGELLGKTKEISVPPLSPNQEGRISAVMTAPNATSIHTYQSHWRLHHRGEPFGQRLVCKIIVDPNMAAASSSDQKTPTENKGLPKVAESEKTVRPDELLADFRAKDIGSQARLIEAFKAHRLAYVGESKRNFKSHTATPTSTPFNISPPKSPAPKSMLDNDSSQKDAISTSNILTPTRVEPSNTTNADLEKEYQFEIDLFETLSTGSSSDSMSSGESDGFVVLPLPECFDLSKPFVGCKGSHSSLHWQTSDDEPNSPVKVDSFTLIEKADENEETAPLMAQNSPPSSKYGSIPIQLDPAASNSVKADADGKQSEAPPRDLQQEQASNLLIDETIVAEQTSRLGPERIPEPVAEETSPETSKRPSGKYSILDQSIEEGPLVEDVPDEEDKAKTYNPLDCAPAVDPPSTSSNNEVPKESPQQTPQEIHQEAHQKAQKAHREAHEAHLQAHQAYQQAQQAQQQATLALQQAQQLRLARQHTPSAPQQIPQPIFRQEIPMGPMASQPIPPQLTPIQPTAPQQAPISQVPPQQPARVDYSHVRYPPLVIPLPYHPLNPNRNQSNDQQSGPQPISTNGTGSTQSTFHPPSGPSAPANSQNGRFTFTDLRNSPRDTRYAGSMSILNEMGFWNKALNEELLIKNNFDVIETINELLNPQRGLTNRNGEEDTTGRAEVEPRPARRVNRYGYFDDFD